MTVTTLPFSKDHERREKRALIMGEAAQLFNRHGFGATRHEDLADAIGLTKTSVTYYFDTKEDLALACYEQTFELITEFARNADLKPTALEQFLGLVEQYGTYWRDIHDIKRQPIIKVDYLPDLSKEGRDQVKVLSEPVTSHLLNLLQRGQIDGSFNIDTGPQLLGYCYNTLIAAADKVISGNAESLQIYLDITRIGLDPESAWRLPNTPSEHAQPNVPLGAVFNREMRSKLKRDAFIAAGIRKFNITGFDGVGLAEIAKELGVTRGAFYHHFKDKDALIEAGFDSSLDMVESCIRSARRDGHSGADILSLSIHRALSHNVMGPQPVLKFRLFHDLPDELQNKFRGRLMAITSQLETAIRQGQSDHSLASWPVGIMRVIVMGILQHSAVNGFCAHALRLTDAAARDPSQIPRRHVSALMNGLTNSVEA